MWAQATEDRVALTTVNKAGIRVGTREGTKAEIEEIETAGLARARAKAKTRVTETRDKGRGRGKVS